MISMVSNSLVSVSVMSAVHRDSSCICSCLKSMIAALTGEFLVTCYIVLFCFYFALLYVLFNCVKCMMHVVSTVCHSVNKSLVL